MLSIKNKIKDKFLTYIGGIIFIILLGLSVFTHISLSSYSVNNAKDITTTIAENANYRIDALFKDIEILAQSLSKMAAFQELDKKSISNVLNAALHPRKKIIRSMYFGAINGELTYSYYHSNMPEDLQKYIAQRNFKTQPWYLTAMRNSGFRLTEPYRFPDQRVNGISAVIPVYNKNRILAGVIGFDFQLDIIPQIIEMLNISMGGKAVLLNKSGQLIMINSRDETLSDSGRNFSLFDKPTQREIMNNVSGSRIARMHGKRMVISFTRNNLSEWIVIVAIPYKNVMREGIKQLRIFAILYAVLIVIVLITLNFLLNTLLKPIRLLTEGANKIKEKDYNFIIHSKETNEIGTLAETYNVMAVAIKSYISELNEKHRIISQQFNRAIKTIASFISNSSTKIYESTEKVTEIVVMLSRKLGLSEKEIRDIEIASILHDVGMVGKIEHLLYTRGKLTEDELKLLKSHPEKSARIINDLKGTDEVTRAILQHHERYDGSGYPLGLKGDEICLGAQLIGLVDDFVAILKKKRFQSRDKKEKIFEEIKKNINVLYPQKITKAFLELIEEKNLIYLVDDNDFSEEIRKNHYIWQFPSNLNLEVIITGKIMDKIRSIIKSEATAFFIEYSINEVIRNAIIHGNKFSLEKTVTAEVLIEDMDNDKRKLIFIIRDQGEGMDLNEHSQFRKIRKELFDIVSDFEEYGKSCGLTDDPQFNEKFSRLEKFSFEYYADYHTFQHRADKPEITAGIGLIQVQNTFDSVEYRNIIEDSEVKGLEIKMTIQIPA